MKSLKFLPVIFLLFLAFSCKENPTLSDQAEKIENNILILINEYRKTHNLPELKLKSPIVKECRTHSNNMRDGITAFGHDGFDQRVTNLSKIYNLKNMSENLGMIIGYIEVSEKIFETWLSSTSHKHNILGSFMYTGIGVAVSGDREYYITQIFLDTK